MRFSSVFQFPRIPAMQVGAARRAGATPEQPPVTAAPPIELPDDLDARVRLLGEWQLFES
jgi:hypothetical protein